MKQVLISSFNEVMNNKRKFKTQEAMGHIGVGTDGDGVQGEYNERFIFYKHPTFPEGVFLRETLHTNSYGDDESIVKFEFVKGKEKTITVFEPIN